MRSVDVLLDHGCPVVRQVAGQLGQDLLIVNGEVGGEDERTPVTFLPEAVNDRRHQSKHPTRALERHQCRPVGIQTIEDLGVNRVRGLQPLLVVGVPALRWKLLMVRTVEIGECARDDIAVPESGRVVERLEQAPPDNLEAFLSARRPPRRLDTSDHIPQPAERFPTTLPTHFDIVRLGMRRVGGIRRGEADDEEAVIDRLRRLGQHLRERELRLEASGREIALVVELTRVRHPLVDQDEARPVLVKKLA